MTSSWVQYHIARPHPKYTFKWFVVRLNITIFPVTILKHGVCFTWATYKPPYGCIALHSRVSWDWSVHHIKRQDCMLMARDISCKQPYVNVTFTRLHCFLIRCVLMIFMYLITIMIDTPSPTPIMKTSSNGNISVLLILCVGNSPVTGEFPLQRPVRRSFDIFFVLSLNNMNDLRRHRAHYDGIVRITLYSPQN